MGSEQTGTLSFYHRKTFVASFLRARLCFQITGVRVCGQWCTPNLFSIISLMVEFFLKGITHISDVSHRRRRTEFEVFLGTWGLGWESRASSLGRGSIRRSGCHSSLCLASCATLSKFLHLSGSQMLAWQHEVFILILVISGSITCVCAMWSDSDVNTKAMKVLKAICLIH